MSILARLAEIQQTIATVGGVDHLPKEERASFAEELKLTLKRIETTYKAVQHQIKQYEESIKKEFTPSTRGNNTQRQREHAKEVESLRKEKAVTEKKAHDLYNLGRTVRPVYDQLAPKSTCSKVVTVKNALYTVGALTVTGALYAANAYLFTSTKL